MAVTFAQPPHVPGASDGAAQAERHASLDHAESPSRLRRAKACPRQTALQHGLAAASFDALVDRWSPQIASEIVRQGTRWFASLPRGELGRTYGRRTVALVDRGAHGTVTVRRGPRAIGELSALMLPSPRYSGE